MVQHKHLVLELVDLHLEFLVEVVVERVVLLVDQLLLRGAEVDLQGVVYLLQLLRGEVVVLLQDCQPVTVLEEVFSESGDVLL